MHVSASLGKPLGSNQTGFIPFNLQLDIDGLSGIRIYQKLNVDTNFLPSNYPNTLDFVVTKVNHLIKDNYWQTSLDTMAIAISAPVIEVPKNSIKSRPFIRSSASTNGPNANKLRTTLDELGYIEKGAEIDNGGDISSSLEKAASSLFRKIKELYPTYNIKVTGGNDTYHQNLSYNSRHKSGRGLDFVVTPSNEEALDNIVKILKGFAAGSGYPNFRFIDEYRRLTSAGTANHFHISWGSGTEAKNTIEKAKKEANQNKFPIYNIT